MSNIIFTIDIDCLREDLRDDDLGAFYGAGFGGALMESFDIERATPEKFVRQQTIQFLIDYLGVPQDRIIVERTLSRFGVEGDRRRIDIGILDQEGEITAVVECKVSIVGDHEAACIQAQDYLQALHAKFFFVTDGMTFKGYRFKMMSFLQLEDIPHYEEWT